jgi:hypothetical protein
MIAHRRAVRLFTSALAALTLASLNSVCAGTTIDFEAPTYTTGNLIGQDGWAKNGYYGTLNGDVTVSSASPLGGAQSLSYSETVAGGFSDVNKPNAMLVNAGVTGTDMTLSYVIKADSNAFGSPNGGIFLGNGAGGGASPIFARINGGIVEVGSAGAVVPVNDFFFLEGERIKMTYELDFDMSKMNLILEDLDFPGTPFSGSYSFFAGYGAPTGPNGEYQVDVAAFLRGGNVQIDDITLTAGVGPLVTHYDWAGTASGNWNQGNNWTPNGVPGTLAGRQSVTLGTTTSAQTIYNNAARNLNSLVFDNANSYFLTGAGSFEFQSDTSGPTTIAPTVQVMNGHHQIQTPVTLDSNTSITVASGASLDLNNQINLDGNTLTTTGDVRINGSTIGGGTVMSLGSLETNGVANISGNLVSEGSLLVSVDSKSADVFNVAGDATLSGILDVQWTPGHVPAGPLTVVAAGGTLDASQLRLDSSDAASFALQANGGTLTLTYLGAVPEPAAGALAIMSVVAFAGARRRRKFAAAVLGLLMTVGLVSPASATIFDFENPPYTPGTIIGQDNWATNGYVLADPFFGGQINGTVEISNSSPLNGAQSVLYTQTIDPPTAGATGASDVGRPNSVFATKDGTTAVDITASVRVRTDENGVGTGSMGFFLGRGASSPIFFRIDSASTTAATGSILVGDGAAVPTVGSYLPNKTYEFTIGVDVDNLNYTLSSKNLTDNTAPVNYTGSGPDGRFVYFSGLPTPAWADDGDGQTFTFDSSLMFRSGVARADDMTLVGDDYTQSQWAGGSGAWSNGGSWIPRIVPNVSAANAPIAIFGNRITSPQTVFTDSTQTVNGLRFDSTNKYVIGGGGAVALKANTIGGTVNPTINVLNGVHDLQVAVNILNDTTVTASPGASIDFDNTVNLGGKTLSTSGAVNLNVGVTGGGTISNSGTLGTAGPTPIAANLNSTGKLQIDLGPANTDFFNITGNATLSGTLDVVMEPGFVPTGSYTVLTVTGTLNAAGLTLDPSDAGTFSLGVVGKSLVLSQSLGGDFDHNGTVNGADLTKWKMDFGHGAGSDANGDGQTDGADFLVWQTNLGRSLGAVTQTPEPCTALLSVAVLGFGAVALRTRHVR